VRLSDVLRDVSDTLAVLEPEPLPVPEALPVRPALEPVGAEARVHALHDVVAAA
jgi:hypothetical protein